jgi:hypothetical protein
MDTNTNIDIKFLTSLKEPINRFYPWDKIQYLNDHPDLFEEVLLNLLSEQLAQKDLIIEGSDNRFLVAMLTLAKYRSLKAMPLIIEVMRLYQEDVDDFLGDVVTEVLPQVIAACYNDDLSMLKNVVIDVNISDDYVRLAPVTALGYLVLNNRLEINQAVDFISDIINYIGSNEPDNLSLLELILDSLAYFSLDSVNKYKLIYPELFEERQFNLLAEISYLEEKYIESGGLPYVLYDKADSEKRFNSVTELGFLLFKDWIHEDVKKVKLPVKTKIKIGRNDLCLCGSGKKYKKCCLMT